MLFTLPILPLLATASKQAQQLRSEAIGAPASVEPPQWVTGLSYQFRGLAACLAALESLDGPNVAIEANAEEIEGSNRTPHSTPAIDMRVSMATLPSPWDCQSTGTTPR